MSKLVLSGDTSGSVTLDAPAVSGTTTLTLLTTSGSFVTSDSSTGGAYNKELDAFIAQKPYVWDELTISWKEITKEI
jgi:hypothetical protein